MTVAHLSLDLRARNQRRHRVDDQDVQRARPDQHVGNLQCLFPGIGLRYQQRIGVDTELGRIVRVKCVLRIDEGRNAAQRLRIGHRVQGHGRLARRLRTVDLDNAAPRQPADPQRNVECDRTGRDDLDGLSGLLAQPHDRALAIVLVDLGQSQVERLLTILRSGGHDVSLRARWSCSVLRASRYRWGLTDPQLLGRAVIGIRFHPETTQTSNVCSPPTRARRVSPPITRDIEITT